ncbi:hypothetical protein O181_027541 [Austropuccinia psidii MF-1]|uniref:Lysophospholipid acyltransferase n=1 Tax=Austropuccinia psidii MF-1 TaxID=1389203 RepID=A0A9Q3H1J3_9BASI|nr:hypothetical protein [Austropuccinia psidii MF-1]
MMAFWDWSEISTRVGVSSDILKLLSLLVLSNPLALILPRLKSFWIDLYSIFISSYFLLFVFSLRFGWFQLLASSVATWSILKISLTCNKPLNRAIPWSIFLGLLSHLTCNHARRIIYNIPYETVEITGSQMVLVMKLSTFAWNVYDGQLSSDKLDSYQKSNSVRNFPNLIHFLGYCFFFPSLLVGPAISFNDYHQYTQAIHLQISLPPRRFFHALKKLAIGTSFAILVGLYGSHLSYEKTLEDQFLSKNFFQRFWHLQIAGFLARAKYYLVWSLAEAAFVMAGCGYDHQKNDWSGGKNIDVKELELAQNYKLVFDNWNMKTNIWLRESVYKRLNSKNAKRPGFLPTMATFATSAAWHGPLPAYFLAFLSGGLFLALGRSIRSTIRPFFNNQSPTLKSIYDTICWLSTQTTLNYLVVPFILLDISKTVTVYNRLGWYGHILTGVPMFILWGLGFETKLKKRHPKDLKPNDTKCIDLKFETKKEI